MEIARSHIDKNGRILIPVFFRKSLHLVPGEKVIIYQEGSELKIRSFHDSLARARGVIKKYNKKNIDLVTQLIKERREENKDL